MSYDSARPYAACFALLKRADGKIAFVLRSHTDWMNDHYGLPAGKVEQDESAVAGTVREAWEEVGVRLRPEHLKHVMTVYRKAEDDTKAWVDVIFEATEWEGEVVNAEPDKHSAVAWFTPDALPDNIVPVLGYALQQIAAGQTYCEYGWEQV